MKNNELKQCPSIIDLARILNCTEQDISLATKSVGVNNLKIQEFIKRKKVIDNGQYLKVYTLTGK